MNCTVWFGKIFLRVPLACLGSREQGSRAGMPVELLENSLQNLLYSSFWDVAGGLGNLVTGLGSAKVGFLAYSMQNFTRNTIGVFVLINGGLRVSK